MDESITHLNLEINLFLNTLKSHSQSGYQIDENTIKLLNATIKNAGELLADAESIAAVAVASTNDDGFDVDILSDINGEYFQCERFITCCICHMQIGVSKEEFEAHLQSVKHQRNKNVRDLSSLSSSAETIFSAPPVSIDTNDDCDEVQKCDVNHNRLSDRTSDNMESTLSSLNQNAIISVTNSPKRENTMNHMAINDIFAMTNGTGRILEESVAFIETDIPFADPVISGCLMF